MGVRYLGTGRPRRMRWGVMLPDARRASKPRWVSMRHIVGALALLAQHVDGEGAGEVGLSGGGHV